MNVISRWLTRGAEFIAAMMLAAIFVTFLAQIFTRYASKIAWMVPIPVINEWMSGLQPIGWTVNLISLLWVWVVFFGCAFVVRERDHVTFDVLYLAVPAPVRKILAYASAVGVIAIMLYALPAHWDAIFANRLMELKKIQTLRLPITGGQIPVKWLFASIVLLMIVALIKSLWQLVTITRNGPPGTELEDLIDDSTKTEAKS